MAKKSLTALFFIIFWGGYAFSQNYGAASFGIYDFDSSFGVPKFQKDANFDFLENPRLKISQLEISNTGAFYINWFIGFGIGSYAQGDKLGGTIGLLGEITGIGLVLIGALAIGPSSTTTDAYGQTTSNYGGVAIGTMIGGAALFFGTRIFEMIRPWFFD